jgi:hypothetical protein
VQLSCLEGPRERAFRFGDFARFGSRESRSLGPSSQAVRRHGHPLAWV